MPVGMLKNQIYGMALPLIGKRCRWREARAENLPAGAQDQSAALALLLRQNHVVGAAIQALRVGKPAERYMAGYARLGSEPLPVACDTFFRTASVAKLATAMLVFRLQTLGKLDVEEDISGFLGAPVRNPQHPQTPITLGMLLSHTSSMVDAPAYFLSFRQDVPLRSLLGNPASFSEGRPGSRFRYSNLAAGMIGSLLENRFGRCFESLAQEYLFAPLGVNATFDLRALDALQVASSYRVLPSGKAPAFDAPKRHKNAVPLTFPDPETHYSLASGNLYITAEGMGRLVLPLLGSISQGGSPFLNARSLKQMKTPLSDWPQKDIRMAHGMGLLLLDDRKVSNHILYGHQGFAYGAVNGVFFDDAGNGFVSLNSGASEQRLGHLSLLNQKLIQFFT